MKWAERSCDSVRGEKSDALRKRTSPSRGVVQVAQRLPTALNLCAAQRSGRRVQPGARESLTRGARQGQSSAVAQIAPCCVEPDHEARLINLLRRRVT